MIKIKKNIGSYFEIPVQDIERAIEFYSFIFDCKFDREIIHKNEMALFPFNEETSGISGALAKGEIYSPSIKGTLIYLNTENIDETLQKITSRGGEILFPKTPVGTIGYVAEFKDSEGNRIALYQSK